MVDYASSEVQSNLFNTDTKETDARTNHELYLHDRTNNYSIARAMFRNQNKTQGNYVTLIIICHEHQNKLKYIL